MVAGWFKGAEQLFEAFDGKLLCARSVNMQSLFPAGIL
jgi:hypothetical protein